MGTTTITRLDTEGLRLADLGSYYTISGCGGDLQEWVNGYTEWLVEAGIGTPTEWFTTTGASVNRYAEHKHGGVLSEGSAFPDDTTFLLFSLNGIGELGRLAIFKITYQDRWFDDIIDNMAVS